MTRISKRISILLTAMLLSSVSVIEPPAAAAERSVEDTLDFALYGALAKLGIAEPTVIFGRLSIVDLEGRRFQISGLADELVAEPRVDLESLEGNDVAVRLRVTGPMRSVEILDETQNAAPQRSMLETMKAWVGMPTRTIIDGVVSVESTTQRSFEINGIDTKYIAPEGIDLDAIDAEKVRIEIDEDGLVAGIAMLPRRS